MGRYYGFRRGNPVPIISGRYQGCTGVVDSAVFQCTVGAPDEYAPGLRAGNWAGDYDYERLKTVYDPEIPVNVVDLGLIHDVKVNSGDVYVQMTLTAPGCGMGPYIAQQAEWAIQDIEGVEEVEIEVVFDPPWFPDLISDVTRNQLGI